MKKNYFIFLIAILAFNSCYVHRSGHITSGPLLNINDKYVGIACGAAKAKINGLKDFSKEQLMMEAKMNMFKNRPLKKGEYYSNFILNVEIRQRPFKLFTPTYMDLTICADVLSQNHQNDTIPFSPDFLSLMDATSRHNSFVTFNVVVPYENSFTANEIIYKVNETVYVDLGNDEDEYLAMEIVSIQGKMVNLRYLNLPKPNKIVDHSEYEFYSASKSLNGFVKGDKVKIMSASNSEKTIDGVVLAANAYKIIVSSEYGINPYLPARLKK